MKQSVCYYDSVIISSLLFFDKHAVLFSTTKNCFAKLFPRNIPFFFITHNLFGVCASTSHALCTFSLSLGFRQANSHLWFTAFWPSSLLSRCQCFNGTQCWSCRVCALNFGFLLCWLEPQSTFGSHPLSWLLLMCHSF